LTNSGNEKIDSTEQRIFDAAHEVFTQKGMDGAKMQDIAEKAGINKALLHYYYRTKEKLYEAVAKVVINRAVPALRQVLESELPLQQKLYGFIDTYIGLIRLNPFIPLFIISEVNKHPQHFFDKILPADLPQPQNFIKQVEEAIQQGKIREINPRHLIINVVSLCVFPFIARPIARIVLGMSATNMEQFLDERKEEVKSFVAAALRPEQVIS
jgi:TetR/AcrR family transcriptional regulator